MSFLIIILLILVALTIALYVWFYRARDTDFSTQSQIPFIDEENKSGDRHERTLEHR